MDKLVVYGGSWTSTDMVYNTKTDIYLKVDLRRGYGVSLNGHSGAAGGDRILRQSKWPQRRGRWR
jgi:hypothetical protein